MPLLVRVEDQKQPKYAWNGQWTNECTLTQWNTMQQEWNIQKWKRPLYTEWSSLYTVSWKEQNIE